MIHMESLLGQPNFAKCKFYLLEVGGPSVADLGFPKGGCANRKGGANLLFA